MGRMKEIYMELQEKFNGAIPVDFDFDAYLAEKANEKSQTPSNLSSCCGADMSRMVTEDGPDFSDLGICPECQDHC